MKLTLATVLAATLATGAVQAQSSIFTGDYTISAGIGGALPMDRSDRSVIIDNNTSPGPFPGSTLVELLGSDALDYGTGFSGELEFKAGLTFGGSAFIRADGMSSNGETGLSFGDSEDGAIPGSYDDGFRTENGFDNQAEIESRAFSLAVGYEHPFANGFTGSVGLMYARVSQDLEINLNPDLSDSARSVATGEGDNQMGGLVIGAGYEHAINQSWSVAFSGNAALLANSYDYDYLRVGEDGTIDQEADNDGNSTVIRLDAEAKAIYNFRPNTKLTGAIGITNYSGVSTGLDNLLNEDNTATEIEDATTDFTYSYARLGLEITF